MFFKETNNINYLIFFIMFFTYFQNGIANLQPSFIYIIDPSKKMLLNQRISTFMFPQVKILDNLSLHYKVFV